MDSEIKDIFNRHEVEVNTESTKHQELFGKVHHSIQENLSEIKTGLKDQQNTRTTQQAEL